MDAVKNKKLWEVDIESQVNQLSEELMDVGTNTRQLMQNKRIKDQKRKLLLEMKSFYKISVKYLLDKLPIKNELLENIRCLNPANKADPIFADGSHIRSIALKLCGRVDANTSRIVDEWKLRLG